MYAHKTSSSSKKLIINFYAKNTIAQYKKISWSIEYEDVVCVFICIQFRASSYD